MSHTTEDLIALSPCAPASTANSSISSPTHRTVFLNTQLEASPQAISNSNFINAHSNSNLQEMACKESGIVNYQYGSHVIISPLPESITKRDILCRVRGGKVVSCILSKFQEHLLAIVKFEDLASAQHYVDFCAESFNEGIWTFPSGPGFVSYSHVGMSAQVKIYSDAPGLGATWHSEDVPGFPRVYSSSTTRCLLLENCRVDRVTRVWTELGLDSSEHLRNQLDDMWLDRPGCNTAAGEACGTLHIWYADIRAAIEAQRRCPKLKYEADPCSIMPTEAFILGLDNSNLDSQDGPKDVYIDLHSYPFVSLLDLHRMSVLDGVSRGTLDPYEIFWGTRAAQPVAEPVDPKDLTERLMHVLHTHVEGQGAVADGGSQATIMYPPPGFAVQRSGGIEGSFMKPPVLGMASQPDRSHTHTGMNYGSIEMHSESHHNHDDPVTGMSYGSACVPQSTATYHVDSPRPGRLDFKMPRPQPGYIHQFPPPMSGEPQVVEYPPTIAEAMNRESRGPGYLARRIASLGRQYHHQRPSCIHTVVSQYPTDGDTSHQSGRSAGSGDADIRVQANNTATCTTAPFSVTSLVSESPTGSDNSDNENAGSSSNSPPQTAPNYTRENWGGGRRLEDVFWTVSLEEFQSMDDDQWKAFGTSFYIPPAGYNTAERHVVPLE